MDLLEWKKKNERPAGYAHFDKKIGLNSVWNYITNPSKVATHSFLPFIHYDQVFYKFSKKKKKKKGKVKDKIRPICYSSHIDRCIYQYYGYLLNEKYNEFVYKSGISNSVVAYRTNLHKNNIHFAKEAFDFMKKSDCNIMVGDFTGFFDNLDHKYLKKTLCEVLDVKTLSDDWYAVFKNITKYSKWDLIDLLKLNNLVSDDDIRLKQEAHKDALNGNTRKARYYIKEFDYKIKELNNKDLALTKDDFKKYKKKYLSYNEKSFGIPQGSSISAVLSNVYMIYFDKKINEFVSKFNGLYLRYSDDFIIILPQYNEIKFEEIHKFLNNVVKETDRLSLQRDKTQMYSYKNNKILNITNPKNIYEDHIDYLGFIFDGKEVTLRPKTISKYYYRMYRKLNHIVKSKGVTKYKRKISYENLYRTYTQKGRNGEYDKSKFPQKVISVDKKNPYKSGNFFSYVYKADSIFNPEYVGSNKVDKPKNAKEPITRSTQRHLLKIRRKRDKI